MSRSLWVAFAVVVVSVIASVVVLLGLFGLNPLALPLPNLGDAGDPGEQANIISAIAALSSAISTILALAVGAIAILVLVRLNAAESTSVEQLKRDLLSLDSALLAVRNRSVFYSGTSPKLVNLELDPFEHERESLSRLLLSPTGFALYLWAETDGQDKYADLFIDIGSLVNLLTLDLQENLEPVVKEIAWRSTALVTELGSLDASDRRTMAGYLSNLDRSQRVASSRGESDRLASLVRMWREESLAAIPPPTEAELESLKGEADQKIGGKSADTIEHFGRLAIDGSANDRRNFQKLIKALLGAELGDAADETGEAGIPDADVASRRRMFQHLKAKGVNDPNVDLFLALIDDDAEALKAAIDAGADPNITDRQVLSAHAADLADLDA